MHAPSRPLRQLSAEWNTLRTPLRRYASQQEEDEEEEGISFSQTVSGAAVVGASSSIGE